MNINNASFLQNRFVEQPFSEDLPKLNLAQRLSNKINVSKSIVNSYAVNKKLMVKVALGATGTLFTAAGLYSQYASGGVKTVLPQNNHSDYAQKVIIGLLGGSFLYMVLRGNKNHENNKSENLVHSPNDKNRSGAILAKKIDQNGIDLSTGSNVTEAVGPLVDPDVQSENLVHSPDDNNRSAGILAEKIDQNGIDLSTGSNVTEDVGPLVDPEVRNSEAVEKGIESKFSYPNFLRYNEFINNNEKSPKKILKDFSYKELLFLYHYPEKKAQNTIDFKGLEECYKKVEAGWNSVYTEISNFKLLVKAELNVKKKELFTDNSKKKSANNAAILSKKAPIDDQQIENQNLNNVPQIAFK